MIYPDEDMKRWECCDTQVVLANADYYYTKGQVDKKLDEIDGMTEEEVQTMIDRSIRTKADKTDVDSLSGQVEDNTEAIANTYTKREVDNAITALTQTVSNNYDELTGQTSNLDANKFGYVNYDSTTHRINFYNHDIQQTPLAYVDATDFIKDGMVSNVEISEGNLVITFNSDAGKQPISIPLTSIFDPANYYTTAQTQSYVNGFTYDKATIDQKVAEGGTFDPDLYYDKTATDALLAAKADTATTYTKTEVDAALGNKADTSAVTAVANDVSTVSWQLQTKVGTSDFNTYTAATETALNGKVNTSALNDYYTKTEVYNKQEVDTAYETAYQALTAHTADTTVHVTSAEKTTWSNKSDFSGDYNDLTNKPTIPTVPTNISDFTNDAGYITNADITGKADTTAVTQVNDALTAHTANTSVHVTSAEKAEWDDKAEVIELTQAQYNALATKDPDVLYVISDAAPAEVIITTTITSSSTNGEAASAKAVYDFVGGLKMVKITSADYQALATKDANTVYFVGDATNGYTMKLGEANIN